MIEEIKNDEEVVLKKELDVPVEVVSCEAKEEVKAKAEEKPKEEVSCEDIDLEDSSVYSTTWPPKWFTRIFGTRTDEQVTKLLLFAFILMCIGFSIIAFKHVTLVEAYNACTQFANVTAPTFFQ